MCDKTAVIKRILFKLNLLKRASYEEFKIIFLKNIYHTIIQEFNISSR